MGRYLLKYACCIVVFAVCVTVSLAHAAPSGIKKAVLLRPDMQNMPFWDMVEESMRAAADDLGISLEVHSIMIDPIKQVQKARQIARSENKPDIVFFYSAANTGPLVIQALDEAGIGVMTVNGGITDEEAEKIGRPREKYKHWIGEVLLDHYKAGEQQATYLYEQARRLEINHNNKIHVAAIGGGLKIEPSVLRMKALNDVAARHDNMVVEGVMNGMWQIEPSAAAAEALWDMYPKTQIFWTINDEAAIGAVQALRNKGMKAGRDVLVGGIGWLEQSLPYIKSGEISVSYGGQFMNGVWALILAYDYYNGHDFEPLSGTRVVVPLSRLDQASYARHSSWLESKGWNDINFKQLSQVHNPELSKYNFDLFHYAKR